MAKMFDAIVDVGHRAYCGPMAIARLTGVPVSHAEKMIRRCRRGGYRASNGRQLPIKSTYTSEVVKVLKRLGCKVDELKTVEKTLGLFIEDTKHLDSTFLVNVTRHFLIVHKGAISDSFPQLKRHVQRVWRVEAPEVPKYKAPEPKPERPKKPKPDLKEVRRQRVLSRIIEWEAKRKRAETALKKLRRQARYYERSLTA